MKSWTDGLVSIILDRSAEQLIGAVLLALVLSAGFASLGVWLIRSRRDETTRMTGVMLVLSLTSMLLSATFIRQQYDPRRTDRRPRRTFDFAPGDPLPIPRIARMLDGDGDGNASPEELRWAEDALGFRNRMPGDPPRYTPPGGPDGPVGPDGAVPASGPGRDGRPGGPGAARELHDSPAEEGAGPPSTVPGGPSAAPTSTEEHP